VDGTVACASSGVREKRSSVFGVTSQGAQRFTLGKKAVDVERVGTNWKLSHQHQVVRTRDISAGVDELLGKGRGNMELVLRILEWDTSTRP
jgi:hypothetical protein